MPESTYTANYMLVGHQSSMLKKMEFGLIKTDSSQHQANISFEERLGEKHYKIKIKTHQPP